MGCVLSVILISKGIALEELCLVLDEEADDSLHANCTNC